MKITLGNRPATVPAVVRFPMPGGEEGVVNVQFKYRTRREYGVFLDEMKAMADKRAAESGKDWQTAVGAAVSGNAAYLADIVKGWDLEVELSDQALDQLCDEMPGAAEAFVAAYRVALTEGRSGN